MSKIKDNTSGLQAILNAVNGLPSADTTEYEVYEGPYQVTPAVSSQTLDTSNKLMQEDVTVNAMPTATQATPFIAVDTNGLITATATQTAGYVTAGTKSGTKQLTTQASKTITPSESSQTAVASGVYTTGAVTVAAIPSQYITTTDATAAAADLRTGKTAYVNGSKVAGTIQDFDGSYECSGESTGGGSGGGGGSVETCTVNVVIKDGFYNLYAYTAYENNAFVAKTGFYAGGLTTNLSLPDVVCGTPLTFYYVTDVPEAKTSGGVTLTTSFTYVYIFTAPTEPNAVATITFQND